MTLEQQFLSMGMTPEEAKKNAEGFVAGLKELGLSDTTDNLEFEPVAARTNSLNSTLARIGVRTTNIQTYSSHLSKTMHEFKINTKQRSSMFLAQILHESAMLSVVLENLNYSEQGLIKVFKKYFDRNTAKKYARNPQRIANRVYANRMGNGNEDSGDGWKFRGRGLIQLTGKENYLECGKALGVDLINNPDYLLTPVGACRSAGWFWNKNNLNRSADLGDIHLNTRIINGGLNGFAHRQNLYYKLLEFL